MENISVMCSNIKKGGGKQLLRLKNELEMVVWIRNVSEFFFQNGNGIVCFIQIYTTTMTKIEFNSVNLWALWS